MVTGCVWGFDAVSATHVGPTSTMGAMTEKGCDCALNCVATEMV